MTSCLTFCLLFCMSVVFLHAAAPPPNTYTFVLKDKAVVSDRIVRLNDIALMDTAARNRIGKLVVAVSPVMGATGSIKKQSVYEKLIGNGIQSPKVQGADVVKITRSGVRLHPSFFKDQIRDYVISHSRWKDGVEVEVVTNKEIIVPHSNMRWQLTPANGQDFFGNILFKATAFSPATNEVAFSSWITAKLRIQKLVAVSNRTIQKSEPIGTDAIRWEKRELTAYNREAVFDKEALFGQKAGRIIRPNSVITKNHLEKKYLVRRGANAVMEAKFKNIKATSMVRVLSDGSLGDTVKVVTLNSKKILAATVTGRNRLEVSVQ